MTTPAPRFAPGRAISFEFRVALLGAGTVGASVMRGFIERPDRLTPADGPALRLVAVAEKDAERARQQGVPDELISTSAKDLIESPQIEAVVELIGGEEPARTFISAAFRNGKGVVTANKHVIAHHGPELEALSRETGSPFRFEAAVGGGIPLLGPLASELATNRIRSIRGIVNGTTNYILTAMAEEHRPYAEVLAAAQAAGYAEANPAGDVEALDAVNKAVILGRLAFGGWVHPSAVVRRPPLLEGRGLPGITGVTGRDIAAAAAFGLVIKLVTLVRGGTSVPIEIAVVPTAVAADSVLGTTRGVTNAVEVIGDPIGTVAFSGPGAGGPATSSAVLGDLLALARGLGSTWGGLPPAVAVDADLDTMEAAWLDSPHGWLVHIPATQELPAAQDGIEITVVEGGLALRSEPRPLAAIREIVRRIAPAGLNPVIYPVEAPRSR